jgi:hypothetical protein
VTYGATFLGGAGDQTIRDVGGPITIRIDAPAGRAQLCNVPAHSTS